MVMMPVLLILWIIIFSIEKTLNLRHFWYCKLINKQNLKVHF